MKSSLDEQKKRRSNQFKREMMMNTIEIGKKVLLSEARMLEMLASQLDGSLDLAVQMLAECKGHVIVSGVGTTGIVARRFAHLLCNVGCPALFLHAGDSLHGSSGAVKKEDVVVLFSKTGETMETCNLAQIVSRRGTPIITLSARPESTIGKLSTILIRVDTPPEVDPFGGLMAVGSSLAMEAVCDTMIFGVLELKGTPRQEFVSGHPGGIIAKMASEDSSKV
jgi:arabinose-5-phosphate isomerase